MRSCEDSVGELALNKQVFHQLEVGSLLEIILPATSDQIGQPLVRVAWDRRPHLLAKFLLDSSCIHACEGDLSYL